MWFKYTVSQLIQFLNIKKLDLHLHLHWKFAQRYQIDCYHKIQVTTMRRLSTLSNSQSERTATSYLPLRLPGCKKRVVTVFHHFLWPSSDHLVTICKKRVVTFFTIFFLVSILWPSCDHLVTICKTRVVTFSPVFVTILWPFCDHLVTILWPSYDHLVTILRPSVRRE